MGCLTSSDCGSGWSCINGLCTDTTNQTSPPGTNTSCGTSNPSPPGNDCGGCTSPGCSGTVNCPPPGGGGFGGLCVPFCDEYLKANGEQSDLCDEGDTCPVCEECIFDDTVGYTQCVEKENTGNCNCDKDCGDCETCVSDENASNYGSCKKNDNCLDCCEQSRTCSCGIEVTCKVCAPRGSNSVVTAPCEICTRNECDKVCPPPDPTPECEFNDDCSSCDVCALGTCVTPSECNDPCGVTILPDGSTVQKFPIETQQYTLRRISDDVSVGLTPRTTPGSAPQYYTDGAGFQIWYFVSPCRFYTELLSGCNVNTAPCYADPTGSVGTNCCSCKCPDLPQDGCDESCL